MGPDERDGLLPRCCGGLVARTGPAVRRRSNPRRQDAGRTGGAAHPRGAGRPVRCRPSASHARMCPENASSSCTDTLGRRSRAATTRRAPTRLLIELGRPIATVAGPAVSRRCTSARARSMSRRMTRACSWKIRPGSVRLTPRAVLSNSLIPSSSSRRSRIWLRVGWAMSRRPAARVTEPSSVVVRKQRSWWPSTFAPPSAHASKTGGLMTIVPDGEAAE